MGNANWDPGQWKQYSQQTQQKTQQQVFTSSVLHADLDPRNFKVRESCDSTANPNSTPIMVFADVTGSMGILAENLIKRGLGILFEEIRERKPVSDPHILVGAIGDAYRDQAPIQLSQFEADLKIAEQTEKIYLEGNGGGNNGESYNLAHYAAAFRTKTDAWNLHGRRGYLFTIGDEPPHPELPRSAIERFFGDSVEADMSSKDLYDAASRLYYCYHIIVSEGSHIQYHGLDCVRNPWRKLMGEHAIVLDNIENLAETIVSIIQVNEGANIDDVAGSWGGGTSVVVRNAIGGLTATAAGAVGSTGVATL